jgi:hypothetical protein
MTRNSKEMAGRKARNSTERLTDMARDSDEHQYDRINWKAHQNEQKH